MESPDRIAVSSWSLHRLLGVTYPHDMNSLAVGSREETFGPARADLLELPALAAAHGIRRLEICSFHLPSKDAAYLAELRQTFRSADVTFQTLLIDAGDISDPETADRDAAWISDWVRVAAEAGAEYARIVAGKQPPEKLALDRAIAALLQIAREHEGASVKLATENWFDLLSKPENVHYLLDRTEGRIALNGDFGNWRGPHKYDDLRAIFSRAVLCHAKATFKDGVMDTDDYGRCLGAAEAAGYRGPYTLIFDADAPDEWAGIAAERSFVIERLAEANAGGPSH